MGLLITDPAAPSLRVTMDVDVITEVTSMREYYQLAEKLRLRGFVEDQSQGAPICRWKLGNTILDVMPTKPDLRGRGDYRLSHDIEDIVAVLDGRAEILDEILKASKSLQTYLADRFATLLETQEFIEALAGHLPGDAASQGRMPLIKERIEAIARQGP